MLKNILKITYSSCVFIYCLYQGEFICEQSHWNTFCYDLFCNFNAIANMLGIGMWFWIILIIGAFVAISQFILPLRGAGSGVALLLSGISLLAVLFGLLAATIGGSFRMDDNSALLLLLFFIISVLGTALAIMYKKTVSQKTL